MLGLRVEKSIGVDGEAEVRGDGNGVVSGETVMRRDGQEPEARRDATETIRCDMWARRVQLLLSHHDTRNLGLSGCIEVNFSLF